jgi:hypothetical protein
MKFYTGGLRFIKKESFISQQYYLLHFVDKSNKH